MSNVQTGGLIYLMWILHAEKITTKICFLNIHFESGLKWKTFFKLQVAALHVTEKARERILKAGGEVMTLDQLDPTACPECDYHGDKPKTLAIHVGLVHAKLDLMLSDMSLVQKKRADFIAKPKKVSIGRSCPVCDMKFNKSQNRDHVSWHYIEELRSIVQ